MERSENVEVQDLGTDGFKQRENFMKYEAGGNVHQNPVDSCWEKIKQYERENPDSDEFTPGWLELARALENAISGGDRDTPWFSY